MHLHLYKWSPLPPLRQQGPARPPLARPAPLRRAASRSAPAASRAAAAPRALLAHTPARSGLKTVPGGELAFTRYCFTSKLYCGSPPSFYCPPPPAKPTLLQYYCTPISQYTLPTDPPFVCHTPYHIGDCNIV